MAPGRVHWDAAGRCQRPHRVERYGRPEAPRSKRNVVVSRHRAKPLLVELDVPCRACPPCLRSRAARWRHRATQEALRSGRTWFGTMTLNPQAHFVMLARARALNADLAEPDEFGARCVEVGKELTLWLKRVRKNSGVKLRYMAVFEAHKSGLPHLHVLVHECSHGETVTHRELSRAWKLGFTRFNLVSEPAAFGYVTKYLTKSAGARVRASTYYGQPIPPKVKEDKSSCPF